MSDARSAFKLACRKLAQGLIVAVYRLRSRRFVAECAGVVTLIVAPHPDDEALGCGGLIQARRALGLPIHILYITDGSGSHPGHPTVAPGQLAERRQNEARAAMQLLGVPDACLHFANAPDGRLARLSDREATSALKEISDVLAHVSPTELFLPYRHDGSSEHIAAFSLVQTALATFPSKPRLYEFPIWSWWSPRLLLRPLGTLKAIHRLDISAWRSLKARALRCYLTQVEPLEPDSAPVLSEGFLKFFMNSAEYYFETHVVVSPPSSSLADRR